LKGGSLSSRKLECPSSSSTITVGGSGFYYTCVP
jgi:hypothetical protein